MAHGIKLTGKLKDKIQGSPQRHRGREHRRDIQTKKMRTKQVIGFKMKPASFMIDRNKTKRFSQPYCLCGKMP